MSHSPVQSTHGQLPFTNEEAAALCAWFPSPVPEDLAACGVDIASVAPLALAVRLARTYADLAAKAGQAEAAADAHLLHSFRRRMGQFERME